MPGSLTLYEGPPGSGKSQRVKEAIADNEVDIQSDFTSLWAAVRGVEREPDTGRYPVRSDDDPALTQGYLSGLQTTAVTLALGRGMRVAVTSGSRGTAEKWAERAAVAGAAFDVKTIDPGIETVADRLADEITGELDESCYQAIERWYGKRPRRKRGKWGF